MKVKSSNVKFFKKYDRLKEVISYSTADQLNHQYPRSLQCLIAGQDLNLQLLGYGIEGYGQENYLWQTFP